MTISKFWRLWPPRPKFAALNYFGTGNLGDEIQTIAALGFLPKVDAWISRERLDQFSSETPHKIILNGWFLHRPEHWPPARCLRPLFISFHLTREIHAGRDGRRRSPQSTVLSPEGVRYLKIHEPIGARDLDTLSQLRAKGLSAYFSGCLTLTLRMPRPLRREDTVYAVDVSDEVCAYLSDRCDIPLTRLTHFDIETVGKDRFEKAKLLLEKYGSARAVVTARLHCALPCLALGTPVLLIDAASKSCRFDGLKNLMRHATGDQILRGEYEFDLRSPSPNSACWYPLRDEMQTNCESFIAER